MPHQIKLYLMKKVQLISKILHFVCRVLLVLYGLTFLHALIAIVFKTSSLNIIEEGKRFEIYYPLCKVSFLIGYFEKGYIIFGFLMILGLYAFFFNLLGNFFKAFSSKKLFIEQNHKYMIWFSYANLGLPILAIILASFSFPITREIQVLGALHVLLGVFAYFLSAIFNQGFFTGTIAFIHATDLRNAGMTFVDDQ